MQSKLTYRQRKEKGIRIPNRGYGPGRVNFQNEVDQQPRRQTYLRNENQPPPPRRPGEALNIVVFGLAQADLLCRWRRT